jgi:hypothetical protein
VFAYLNMSNQFRVLHSIDNSEICEIEWEMGCGSPDILVSTCVLREIGRVSLDMLVGTCVLWKIGRESLDMLMSTCVLGDWP